VAPGGVAGDVARAHIYNGLVASGFAQIGTRVALGVPDDDLSTANTRWQERRDETLRQLDATASGARSPRRGSALNQ
jgi:hypothetical protein